MSRQAQKDADAFIVSALIEEQASNRLRKAARERRQRGQSNLEDARAQRGERKKQEQISLERARAAQQRRRARLETSDAVSGVSSPSLRPYGSPTLADARSQLRGLIPATGRTPEVTPGSLSLAVTGIASDSRRQQSPFLGQETAEQIGARFGPTTIARNLQGQLGALDSTPQPSYSDDSTIPGTPATSLPYTPETNALLAGNNSTVRRINAELDDRDTPMTAAEPHAAALDAVGDVATGDAAAVGLDADSEAHMDDYTAGFDELGALMQALLGGDNDDDAPATASAGTQATPADGDTDAVRRREAMDMLRASPGLIKLIQTGDYKFDDFITSGAVDMRKLQAVREDIRDRIESTEDSYALAAKAKGYTPSGAAYPVTGVNNIVAGSRRVGTSRYTMYQGPQYVNG